MQHTATIRAEGHTTYEPTSGPRKLADQKHGRGKRDARAPKRLWTLRPHQRGATMDYQQGFTSGPAT